jgi:acyl-coenzyme A thioesterase PaaI-like protein
MDPLDQPLDGRLFGAGQPCFGCGPDHPIGFRLAFARAGDAVTTRFTPGERYQGPPGIMHGGLVTTLADEIAAWTLLGLLGKFGFTTNIAGALRRPVRIGVEVAGSGRLVKETRRVVRVGVDVAQEGATCFAAELTFVLLDRGGAERLLGGPVPESWLRFCR